MNTDRIDQRRSAYHQRNQRTIGLCIAGGCGEHSAGVGGVARPRLSAALRGVRPHGRLAVRRLPGGLPRLSAAVVRALRPTTPQSGGVPCLPGEVIIAARGAVGGAPRGAPARRRARAQVRGGAGPGDAAGRADGRHLLSGAAPCGGGGPRAAAPAARAAAGLQPGGAAGAGAGAPPRPAPPRGVAGARAQHALAGRAHTRRALGQRGRCLSCRRRCKRRRRARRAARAPGG